MRIYDAEIELLKPSESSRRGPLPEGCFKGRINLHGVEDRDFRAWYDGVLPLGSAKTAKVAFLSASTEGLVSLGKEYDIMEVGKIGVVRLKSFRE